MERCLGAGGFPSGAATLDLKIFRLALVRAVATTAASSMLGLPLFFGLILFWLLFLDLVLLTRPKGTKLRFQPVHYY